MEINIPVHTNKNKRTQKRITIKYQITTTMMANNNDPNFFCFACIVGVGVMLTLILVPLSFSYVE